MVNHMYIIYLPDSDIRKSSKVNLKAQTAKLFKYKLTATKENEVHPRCKSDIYIYYVLNSI